MIYNTVLDTRTIGPFSQNTNLADQTISLGFQIICTCRVSKELQWCPLANAQLSIFFENKIIQFTPGTDGTFRITIPQMLRTGYTIIAKMLLQGRLVFLYYYQTGDPSEPSLKTWPSDHPIYRSTLAGDGLAQRRVVERERQGCRAQWVGCSGECMAAARYVTGDRENCGGCGHLQCSGTVGFCRRTGGWCSLIHPLVLW